VGDVPVWYCDADGMLVDGDRLKKDTEALIADQVDFACHQYLSTNMHFSMRQYESRLHWPAGGSYFFNTTEKAKELLDKWDKTYLAMSNFDDQITMEEAWKDTYGLTMRNMPIEYHCEYDDPHGVGHTPVFKQMQVSRNTGYLDTYPAEFVLAKD
jgi:hypothetical protein